VRYDQMNCFGERDLIWGRPRLASVEALETFAAPWRDGRPSIHDLIVGAIAEDRSIDEAVEVAKPPPADPYEIQFIAGLRDNLFGAWGESEKKTDARAVVAALSKVLRSAAPADAAHLFALLKETSTIAIADEVLPRALGDIRDQRDGLAALARRIVRESPEIEPVKAGIALLGVSGTAGDAELLITMGAYDEYTLFCTFALGNLLPQADEAIWALAKGVHGWGRIAAVEALEATQEPHIHAWMLRDGFRNRIMNEYLAHLCATTGRLRAAISAAEVDDELLIGAGEIICALIDGQPGTPIEEYDDGAAVCVAYLRHVSARPLNDVCTIDALIRIKDLVDEKNRERLATAKGWTAAALLSARSLSFDILRRAEVRALIERALAAPDAHHEFHVAALLAPNFGIDVWPMRFKVQEARGAEHYFDQWFWLMRSDDPARIAQVLDLARAQIDLALVGSGPTASLGFGADFRQDNAFDFVLQGLRRFPGLGWDLIKVGLNGRTVRARHMAISALRDWGREAWPSDAEAAVVAAEKREIDEEVRGRIRSLLAGTLRDAEPDEPD
jgi:hypothetical protein